jgi:predicted permease
MILCHRHDLRDGLRTLRRQPAFTLAAVITFVLAIGTTTAIFAALDAVILTPLPFAEPSALVIAWQQDPARAQPVVEVSHWHFREWQARTRSFRGLAAMSSVNIPLTRTLPNGERRKILSAPVSHEFFALLGAAPALGRVFLPEEDRINARGTVILSDAFWTREYARDPSVVGRAITLDDRPFTIVGVMPREFPFPFGAEVWTPISPVIGRQFIDNPSWGVLYVIGRLRPGVEATQAQRELDPLVRQLLREHGLPGADSVSSAVTPLTTFVLGNTRPILLALGGTGIIVLAIACANIIGLLLVRALARQRDSALRITLGAPRRRIVSLWLSESALFGGRRSARRTDARVVGHARAGPVGAGEHSPARSDHTDLDGHGLRGHRRPAVGDRVRTSAGVDGVAPEVARVAAGRRTRQREQVAAAGAARSCRGPARARDGSACRGGPDDPQRPRPASS